MKTKLFIFLGLMATIIVASSFTFLYTSCNSANSMLPPPDYDTYDKDWNTVDSLIKKGLPKSALEWVEKIFSKAQKTDNNPQFLKATLYKLKLEADFKEGFIESTIEDLNAEIGNAEAPVKQILHSIKADLYWRYYQANRYKFLERTTTGNFDNSDIRTWDLKTLLSTVTHNFNLSLQDADLLKVTSLKAYDVILEATEESKKYRPTVFDFLAHRAVDFFMHDESSIIQPAYKFELDKEEYFADASTFKNIKVETKDSLSLKFHAVNILQELIDFHQNDKNPEALIDVDLKRLKFVYQNSVIEKKDDYYLSSLSALENKFNDSPSSTDISYELALQYQRIGLKYNPHESENNKWEIKKAAEICEAAISRFPESVGAKNCKVLLHNIKSPTIQVITENVNVPDVPFLSLVSYKNIPKLWFRAIKIDYNENRELEQKNLRNEQIIKQYRQRTAIKSWSYDIPDDGDFQNHSVELKVPELPLGYYIILAGTGESFDYDSDIISYGTFWISNISYISQKTNEGGYRFYIVNRESGNPLKSTNAQVFFRQYDYNTRGYNYIYGDNYVVDAEGYFEVPPQEAKSRPNSFFLEFKLKDDLLVTKDQFYLTSFYQREDKKEIKTYLFTDRSIYRPGQTIYFKGIVLENFKNNNDVKAGFKTKVEFLDVNYQKVSEQDLSTNEYGSFQGSFIAPTGVLNGNMTIRNKFGSVNILVEEYKRPNFEVVFQPVEGSYKLNEDVTVKGIAKAFAGNNIDNANVKYRVVRKVEYPRWFYGWYNYYNPAPQMEISSGVVTTNENGEFEISFIAIPDLSVPAEHKPFFRYQVTADVTDINNETQSSEISVSVGYTALLVDLQIQDIVEKTTFEKFKIKTTNLNGQPEPATGEISISKLKEPDRLFREKQWENPDIFIIPKEEYSLQFPFDMYKNEGDIGNLKTESVISTIEFNTETDSIINLPDVKNWESGRYLIEVKTSDSYGEKVESKNYFTLYSSEDKKAPGNTINWFYTIKSFGEPGENAAFLIGSKDKNIRVLYEVVSENKTLSKNWIKLNDEQKLIEIPITEEHRGGFSINIVFIKHNRSFDNSFWVDVPYSNKELEFEFLTFRDKLTPGQKEEWKIKIKGKSGDLVAAELLASMYDASLDVFTLHNWDFDIYRKKYSSLLWQTNSAFSTNYLNTYMPRSTPAGNPLYKEYDRLNWFGFSYYGTYHYRDNFTKGAERMQTMSIPPGQTEAMDSDAIGDKTIEEEEKPEELKDDIEKKFVGMQIRRDFRETAFFYPNLYTNEKGEIIILLNIPESLTRWKFMGLAHTKDLKLGQFDKEIVTQKDLMIVPNPPRFFRESDKMSFTAKVVNLSDKELSGTADIQFFNTRTMEDISSLLNPEKDLEEFSVSKGNSQMLEWAINIPEDIDVISYRITAKSGNFTDGEEKAIPVLTNRMLVTESLPLPVNGMETKTFKFDKLINSGSGSKTLRNHKLTLEFSSNPAWYAVQALPYIMETEYESADHIFARFYANSIASYLVNSNPKIKQVFDTWKNFSPDALLSNLEKNEELKSVILQETPWVLEAENESERKQRIALLFDLNRMSDELASTLRMLKQKQSPNGGWPWYKGMRESRHITQNIVTGFGHLKQLGVSDAWNDAETKQMINKAIRYLDQRIKEDYEKLKERNPDGLKNDHIGHIQIQYLYARSYFKNDVAIPKNTIEAFGYYREQAKKYWLEKSKYMQAMIALALNRYGVKSLPYEIVASINEHALYSEEMGMYWRDNRGGFYWYEAPIETQALFIEAFDHITGDKEAVEQMKIWLLKQKQTQDWKTSKATAEAVYALLLRGSDWLANTKLADLKLGDYTIDPMKIEDSKVEAGTGYFKTSWAGGDVKPEMGEITVTNKNENIAWGAVYWQYFENLDKITPHETPLKLAKKLFVEKNTESGPVIEPVEDGSILKVGDKIKVRIELRVDRDMEYVHMKDMRASAFEPVNVISGYRYKGGLGYYESTKDASTNFFFDYLRKGTYVFEYPLVVSQKGDFSNGVTTIQCMYAPEFSSHSEGVRVIID